MKTEVLYDYGKLYLYTCGNAFFTRLTEILETTLEIHVPFSVMHYICTLYFDFGIKRKSYD